MDTGLGKWTVLLDVSGGIEDRIDNRRDLERSEDEDVLRSLRLALNNVGPVQVFVYD